MLGGEKPSGVLSAIGGVVTKRTSVMTPLLVVNFVIGVMATAIYFFKDGAWFGFVFLAGCLIFTFVKYDKFSKNQPWMLSSEQIQRYGMQLTLGDSQQQLTQEQVIEIEPVDNPDLKKKSISDGGDRS